MPKQSKTNSEGFITDPDSPELFEGDIDLNGNPLEAFLKPNLEGDVSVLRTAIKNPYFRWPNGIVPYTISSEFTKKQRMKIQAALKHFQMKTKCIRFKKRIRAKDYIYIRPGKNGVCSSKIGKIGGRQEIKLGNGCFYRGMMLHEIMHTLGFFHEQSRPDRDKYVKINWQNIQHGQVLQFRKYTLLIMNYMGFGYDYDSIMHYGTHAFSRNLRPTISRRKPGPKMGQRERLSKIDIQKVNKLYNSCNTVSKPIARKPGLRSRARQRQKSYSKCKHNFPEYAAVCAILDGYGYCAVKALSQIMTKLCCQTCRK